MSSHVGEVDGPNGAVGFLVCNVFIKSRFSDPDRSLNRKRERFKGFEVGPRSNRGRTVMTS